MSGPDRPGDGAGPDRAPEALGCTAPGRDGASPIATSGLSLRLPAGHWEVLPDEAQRVELRPGEPRETLVWRVPQARWNQARPFTFSLRSGELRMAFSVRYPGPSVVPEVLKELAVVALHGFSGKHL